MRIKEHEKNAIIEAVNAADTDAKVWLFGSRADDSKKGGDIDIAILSKKINGDTMQKIDIVTSSEGKEAFFRLAVEEGIELK